MGFSIYPGLEQIPARRRLGVEHRAPPKPVRCRLGQQAWSISALFMIVVVQFFNIPIDPTIPHEAVMAFPLSHSDKLMNIYLALAQYPILSGRIRQQMRRELFSSGAVRPNDFENEVRKLAVASQEREGLRNPLDEEPAEIWETRISRIRDQLTDLHFSRHYLLEDLEHIINDVLAERGIDVVGLMLSLNPELAPIDLVFEQAMTIERMPEEERANYEARLLETKVVLIRNLISDQLRYINVAKRWFSIADLQDIRVRKIGPGRIGGKAAGMLLAHRILDQVSSIPHETCLTTPESWYIGSDVFYTFMSINNLFSWNDQKYKTESEMRADYPKILKDFQEGEFRPDILQRLETLLDRIGKQPIIVRSSSLLEDNFGTAFAGKYESVFLPNQGTRQENIRAFTQGLSRVYASTMNPNALLYRRSRGLQDYDERMAILIQTVQGETFGQYFLPHGAGVAFSRNLYRWAPQIRREDGFVRLVWGLGTRAVDRVGNDFPRLIALSHPLLRPSTDAKLIRRYSQQYVDLIDLQENCFKTLPVDEVLNANYEPLRFLVQVDEDGFFSSLRTRYFADENKHLVLTFEDLLRRTPFAERIREILRLLEKNYEAPVDLEFTISIKEDSKGNPDLCVAILQCRPQSQLQITAAAALPFEPDPDDIIFETRFVVPEGYLERVDYVAFIPPEEYYRLTDMNQRSDLARLVGRMNAALEKEKFICVGPGRWGSSNSDLGVPIDYGDIYHASALIELTGEKIGLPPEPSLGTHFFQDLIEAQIYPLAIQLDNPENTFRREFFYDTPDHLSEWVNEPAKLAKSLRLVKVADYRPGQHLEIIMSDEKGVAIGLLRPDKPEVDD
ncbi:MAG: PEP/pyruvate-binding domain-containing protein [Bellilinea sp.]